MNFLNVSIYLKAHDYESYVLHKLNKDLQNILECKHKWHDGSWLCTQHFDHMSLNNMDLDTFLVYMQGEKDSPDQSRTPVLVLKIIMQ